MTIPLIDVHNIVDELITSFGGDKGTPISDPPLGLAVHHEAGTSDGTSAYGIARYHVVTEGWSHIGYTWVIERSGALYQTLELTTAPYHAGYYAKAGDDLAKFPNRDPQYYNDHFWAVCLVGNLDVKPPTDAQVETLLNLCGALKRANLPGFKIFGHGELPGKATACPGKYLNMPWVRAEAEKRAVNGPPSAANANGPAPGDEDWATSTGETTWKGVAVRMYGVTKVFGEGLVAAGAAMDAQIAKAEEGLRELRAAREAIKSLTGGK